jgi:hypothetical protein
MNTVLLAIQLPIASARVARCVDLDVVRPHLALQTMLCQVELCGVDLHS